MLNIVSFEFCNLELHQKYGCGIKVSRAITMSDLYNLKCDKRCTPKGKYLCVCGRGGGGARWLCFLLEKTFFQKGQDAQESKQEVKNDVSLVNK